MRPPERIATIAVTAMLVLTAFAPAAVAGSEAGNLAVETGGASDVTETSAAVSGDLTALQEGENATVGVAYWVQGEQDGASTSSTQTLSEPGEFSATLGGLENDTTYVYQAQAEANGTSVAGETATFTTGVTENETENESDAFGLEVSAFVHGVLESNDTSDERVGQMVSEFVTANNPGADNRPEWAGPDGDERRGPPDDEGDDETRRGPPDDKGPDADDTDEDPDADDADDDDENAEEEDDEGSSGPPEHAANDN